MREPVKDGEGKLIEQLFAGLENHLIDVEEQMLPSLEAELQEVRQACKEVSEILSMLEFRVGRVCRGK
jgi:hypothetical protein